MLSDDYARIRDDAEMIIPDDRLQSGMTERLAAVS